MMNPYILVDKILLENYALDVDGSRYKHSMNVIKTALYLNEYYKLDIDQDKVIIAAGLHDVTKFLDNSFQLSLMDEDEKNELGDVSSLYHAFSAPKYLNTRYNIEDVEILNAIKYHSTGRVNMSDFEKIIFISDYIEPLRVGEFVDNARKLAKISLDKTIICILKQTINYLELKKYPISLLSKQVLDYYLSINEDVQVIYDLLTKEKLTNVSLYDVKKQTPYFDYVIIASSNNPHSAKGALQNIQKRLKDLNLPIQNINGGETSNWFLLDASFVIIHIFINEARWEYGLDERYRFI